MSDLEALIAETRFLAEWPKSRSQQFLSAHLLALADALEAALRDTERLDWMLAKASVGLHVPAGMGDRFVSFKDRAAIDAAKGKP